MIIPVCRHCYPCIAVNLLLSFPPRRMHSTSVNGIGRRAIDGGLNGIQTIGCATTAYPKWLCKLHFGRDRWMLCLSPTCAYVCFVFVYTGFLQLSDRFTCVFFSKHSSVGRQFAWFSKHLSERSPYAFTGLKFWSKGCIVQRWTI